MNEIMLSVRPKWCELIASGEKTIEARKVCPKCDVPFKVDIYCTKDARDSGNLWVLNKQRRQEYGGLTAVCANLAERPEYHYYGNGKVIGEFVCDRIINVDCDSIAPFDKDLDLYIDKQICIDRKQFLEYTSGRRCFGWHISGLIIYDKPKQLSEFRNFCAYRNNDGTCQFEKGECDCVNFNFNTDYSVTCAECLDFMSRPPRSWCYVERRA